LPALAAHSWNSKDAIADIVMHLISLGIVRRIEHKLRLGEHFDAGNVKHLTSLADLDTVRFTQFGWDFVRAAIEG
jgi:hypothetical protein